MTERYADAADLAAQKDEQRRRLRQLRSALARDVVESRSREAAANMLPLLSGLTTIALYAGVRGELDPRAAAKDLRQRGVVTVYPRVGDHELQFCAADEDALVPTPFGLLEPSSDPVELSSIDAFVVPGLGFSTDGDRLGYGGGYYDRTLARTPRALRIGFTHEEQILPSIPTSTHDERVDYLVSPQRILRCAHRFSAPVPGANP